MTIKKLPPAYDDDDPIKLARRMLARLEKLSQEDTSALESALGPTMLNTTKGIHVPSLLDIEGTHKVISSDYGTLVNYSVLRHSARLIEAFGRNDQMTYEGVDTVPNGVFRIDAPTPPNYVLGVEIEWSLPRDQSQQFGATIETTQFRNKSTANVDRTIEIAIGAAMNSGTFTLLFAQRVERGDACGWTAGGGCDTLAAGGMQLAVISPAFIAPYCVDQQAAPEPLNIPGATIPNHPDDDPYIQVTVPASFVGQFQCRGRYLVAGSPTVWRTELAMARSMLEAASEV